MGKRGLIIGAALQGAGQGIMTQAEAVRQRALRQMEIDAQTRRDAMRMENDNVQNERSRVQAAQLSQNQIDAAALNTDKTLTAAENRANKENASRETINREDIAGRRGLLIGTRTDENGNVIGVTAGGDKKDLGVKERVKEATAEQKLAIDAAKASATEVDPDTGKTVVNSTKFAKSLKASPDKTVQDIGRMIESGVDVTGIDDELSAVDEARNAAEGVMPLGSSNAGVVRPPAGTAGDDDVDKKAQAEQIRRDYTAKRITLEEANKKLNELYGTR